MGCCGSKSSSTSLPNNLNHNKAKREQKWRATGQIILRDGNLKVSEPFLHTTLFRHSNQDLPTKILALLNVQIVRIFLQDVHLDTIEPSELAQTMARNLQALPSSIREVGSAAKTLDAKNNKIDELPPTLSNLRELQRVVLANNLLENLHHITSLTNLKVLLVDSNQLGHLPAQIGALSRLETLSCSHNLLLSLPASVGQLTGLKYLNCSSNKIVSLPGELGRATALEEINAADNYLQDIPESLGQLSVLKSLSLDKNQIRRIPGAVLQGCALLQGLSLHSNPITPQVLEATPGFAEFESRRQKKVTKQIAGGAIQNLDEGIDRQLADKTK